MEYLQGAHKSALQAMIANIHDSDTVPANVQMLLDSLLPCYFGKVLDAIVGSESKTDKTDERGRTGAGSSDVPLSGDAASDVDLEAPLNGFRMDWGRAHAVLVSKELMSSMADDPEVRIRSGIW